MPPKGLAARVASRVNRMILGNIVFCKIPQCLFYRLNLYQHVISGVAKLHMYGFSFGYMHKLWEGDPGIICRVGSSCKCQLCS